MVSEGEPNIEHCVLHGNVMGYLCVADLTPD